MSRQLTTNMTPQLADLPYGMLRHRVVAALVARGEDPRALTITQVLARVAEGDQEIDGNAEKNRIERIVADWCSVLDARDGGIEVDPALTDAYHAATAQAKGVHLTESNGLTNAACEWLERRATGYATAQVLSGLKRGQAEWFEAYQRLVDAADLEGGEAMASEAIPFALGDEVAVCESYEGWRLPDLIEHIEGEALALLPMLQNAYFYGHRVARDEAPTPCVVVDLTGGAIHQVVSSHPTEIVFLDSHKDAIASEREMGGDAMFAPDLDLAVEGVEAQAADPWVFRTPGVEVNTKLARHYCDFATEDEQRKAFAKRVEHALPS